MINLTEKLSNHFDGIFQIRLFFFLYFELCTISWNFKIFYLIFKSIWKIYEKSASTGYD